MSGDVTILLSAGNQTVEITAVSLASAKIKIASVWTSLFEPGPEREAAAFEVIMTELADSLEARR